MPDHHNPSITEEVLAMLPTLRTFAKNLTRGSDEADDLVQETLLKAISKAHLYRAGTNLRAWLFTIMRNTFYSNSTKRLREPVGRSDCISADIIAFPKQEAVLTGNRIFEALKRIPEPFRETLLLIAVLGESHDDVARIQGCAIGTVKSRMSRARAMMMKEIGASFVGDVMDIAR